MFLADVEIPALAARALGVPFSQSEGWLVADSRRHRFWQRQTGEKATADKYR
jgi:hypothetical protein